MIHEQLNLSERVRVYTGFEYYEIPVSHKFFILEYFQFEIVDRFEIYQWKIKIS